MALDLKHILRIVRRWWWLLLLAPMIGGAAAYFGAYQQPRMYASSAVLLVNAGDSTVAGSIQASRNLSETYSAWVVSRPVLERASSVLEYEGGGDALYYQVSASTVPNTLFIELSATSDDPAEAALIANTVAEQFIVDVQDQTEAQQNQVKSSIDQQITDAQTAIAQLDARIADLQDDVDNISDEESSQLQTLLAERTVLQTELDQLVITLRSIEVETASAQTRIVVQSPAVPSNAPYAPDMLRSTVIGIALGLVLAAAAVVLLEYLDDTVAHSDQFARLSSSPILASIARAPSLRRGGSGLFVLNEPKSPAAEAMRLLRANLDFATAPDRLSSLVVTSPEADEGKSTITANLGVVMAQAGLNVVIIDADLRRPSQHRIFGIENERGISSLLSSPDPDWRQELIGLSIPNLMLIPSGPLPPNPSDLLSLDRFSHVLAGLSEWADVVLIDCPPVLSVSDTLVVSAKARGTMLVCRRRHTRRGTLRRAVALLNQGHARLVGVVLNQTPPDEADHYGHYAEDSTELAPEPVETRYYFGKLKDRSLNQTMSSSNGNVETTINQSGR